MKTPPRFFDNAAFNILCCSLLIVLFFAPHLATASSETTHKNQTIVSLINERLSYMKDVAASKWLAGSQIEDLEREARVLESAAQGGLNYGIKITSSKAFFNVQIQAAKEIQAYWFNHWRTTGEQPSEPPNLDTNIRPALIRLGHGITESLVSDTAEQALLTEKIFAHGLSDETAEELRRAAMNIKQYDNTLSQVLEAGVLRVGTTFDYEPFSSVEPETRLPRGIDIAMAHDLAESLDVELQLISTSWPTLMNDLTSGRFDIGMSGISINLKRHRTAYFSNPYLTGGKTPIARCEDKHRYTSLESIDRQGVRVVVNPGGTNEKFANAHITEATLLLHDDNRTIFKEITQKRADVMFTDAIEVNVQTQKSPTLCAAMPGEFLTFSQKGYLLPQDEAWKHYIDVWLRQRQGDGTLAGIMRQHLEDLR